MPLIAAAAIAAGAALQSATGFGFSLVAAPLVFASVEPEEAGERLDAFLARREAHLSRSRHKALIRAQRQHEQLVIAELGAGLAALERKLGAVLQKRHVV